MRKKIFIALILILMLVPLSIASAKTEKQLRFETYYEFRGAPTGPHGGRTLAWEGFVYEKGNPVPVGTMQWWMFLGPEPPDPPMVSHWEDAYWIIELYDGGVIKGFEEGTSTFLPRWKGALWRANGYVESATGAEGAYAHLVGSKIHDGGEVDFPAWTGTGKIRINK